jgi:hypothetical protein
VGTFGATPGLTSPSCSGNCPAGTFASPPSSCAACSPATACAVPGLSAQPPCYWNVSTLAGNGTAGWADGQGGASMFLMPHGVAVDPASQHVFVSDHTQSRALAAPSYKLRAPSAICERSQLAPSTANA